MRLLLPAQEGCRVIFASAGEISSSHSGRCIASNLDFCDSLSFSSLEISSVELGLSGLHDYSSSLYEK